MSKIKLILIQAFLAFTAARFINPVYPREHFLQHAGTVLLLLPLVADVVNDRMPLTAFAGLLLFASLHVIGARYIHSYVPYIVSIPALPKQTVHQTESDCRDLRCMADNSGRQYGLQAFRVAAHNRHVA